MLCLQSPISPWRQEQHLPTPSAHLYRHVALPSITNIYAQMFCFYSSAVAPGNTTTDGWEKHKGAHTATADKRTRRRVRLFRHQSTARHSVVLSHSTRTRESSRAHKLSPDSFDLRSSIDNVRREGSHGRT